MKRKLDMTESTGKNGRRIFSAFILLMLFSLSACSSVEKSTAEKNPTEEEKWEKSIRSSYRNWEPEKRKQETVFEDVTAENMDIPAQETSTVMPTPMQSSATAIKLPSEVHTVVKGETLWGIARIYYGNGIHWKKIAEANGERLKKGTVINPGLVLVIPSVTVKKEIPANEETAPLSGGTDKKGTAAPVNKEKKIENKETTDSGTGKKK